MNLKLYVKIWCPWCVMAQKFLDERGYQYELIDVEQNRRNYDEMIRLSGQRYTPTLTAGDLILPISGRKSSKPFSVGTA